MLLRVLLVSTDLCNPRLKSLRHGVWCACGVSCVFLSDVRSPDEPRILFLRDKDGVLDPP